MFVTNRKFARQLLCFIQSGCAVTTFERTAVSCVPLYLSNQQHDDDDVVVFEGRSGSSTVTPTLFMEPICVSCQYMSYPIMHSATLPRGILFIAVNYAQQRKSVHKYSDITNTYGITTRSQIGTGDVGQYNE